MIKQSFTLRVLVMSFLLLALPLLIDSFIYFQKSYEEAIRDAKRELKATATERTFAMAAADPAKDTLLKELIFLLGLNSRLEDLDPQSLQRELADLIKPDEGLELLIVFPIEKGVYKVLASNNKSLDNSYLTDFAQLDRVLKDGSGTFIRYSDSKVPILYMARTIIGQKTQNTIGIVVFRTSVENQISKMLERQLEPHTINFALLNEYGVVFAATDKALEGEYFYPLSAEQKRRILLAGEIASETSAAEPLPLITDKKSPFFQFFFNKELQIAYKTSVPRLTMFFVAYSAKREFFGAAVRHFLFLYTIYGLILVIGGGITYWLALWISHPLRQLSQVMGEVGQGNFSHRFREERFGYEINILGSIFNNTVDTLLDNIQKAEDERVKKETYQREVAIARQVQRNLLPTEIPIIEGGDMAGVYLPAREVGGDLYGFMPKKNQQGEEVMVLPIADVSGRGISACLYSLSAYSLFQAYATLSDDVGDILSRSNNDFIKDAGDTGMFLSVFMGMYYPHSKEFSYYSCGHVPAFLKRHSGEIFPLSSEGIALGLKGSKNPYPTQRIKLNSGDLILVYTHGLNEGINPKGEKYSEKQLQYILQDRAWGSSREVVNAIAEDFKAYTQGLEQEDEVIIVSLKVN